MVTSEAFSINLPVYNQPIAHPTEYNVILEHILEFIRYMVQKGGPSTSEDYTALNTALDSLAQYGKSIYCTEEQSSSIRKAFGETLSCETVQGFVFQKPRGYAGDFEVIERIYNYHISKNPRLSNWDRFFHSQRAPKAVRNRVSYFLDQIWNIKTTQPDEARVLNLASGPGRDMYESLKVIGPSKIYFDCVDQDRNALEYAKSLCRDFLTNINFLHQNAVRFAAQKTYHLIWSAGLFDYFSDGLFKRVLKRLLPYLAENGRLVIGNFSENNPSRGYMEIFNWHLYHRSEEKLRKLAEECGVLPKNISIEQEPEGVNLFLHIAQA